MSFQTNYIKIEDAIRVIEQAVKRGDISTKIGENIIHELYEATGPSKYKSPDWKGNPYK